MYSNRLPILLASHDERGLDGVQLLVMQLEPKRTVQLSLEVPSRTVWVKRIGLGLFDARLPRPISENRKLFAQKILCKCGSMISCMSRLPGGSTSSSSLEAGSMPSSSTSHAFASSVSQVADRFISSARGHALSQDVY